MDSKTGFWVRRPGDDDRAGDIDPNRLISGVTPICLGHTKLLLISPEIPVQGVQGGSRVIPCQLEFALQRGCQIFFQVEEQEISGWGALERKTKTDSILGSQRRWKWGVVKIA